MMNWILTLFVLCVGFSSISDSHAIWNGTPDSTNQFSSSFFISAHSIDSDGSISEYYNCGATLIHPQILITATHCVNENAVIDYFLNGSSFSQFNPGLVAAKTTLPEHGLAFLRDAVQKPKAHPTYRETGKYSASVGYDVGYILLKEPITDVQPTHFLYPDYSPELTHTLGLDIQIAGYGMHSPDEDATSSLYGKKCIGEKKISAFNSQWFNTRGGDNAPLEGDSGSGVFTQIGNEHFLIGIVSGSNGVESSNGLISNYATLRPELICWIQKDSGIDLGERSCP